MKLRYLLTVPFMALLSLAACTRSPERAAARHPATVMDEPIVLGTSLKDSLSEKCLRRMGLGDVDGLKIKFRNGSYASYFEYAAEPKDVLREIAHAPFPRYAVLADTVCRKTDFETLAAVRQKLTATEYEAGAFFWNAAAGEYDVYECLKGPVKHTVLVARKGRSVLHRIEYTG